MPQDERHRLLTAAATQVREHDVAAWLSAQLRDLGEIRSDVPSPQ
jgi:trehalose-6-phosphate synthase